MPNPAIEVRKRISAKIEALVALLDLIDGDPDLEPPEEDCCEAADDCGSYGFGFLGRGVPFDLHGPGDPDDTEEDDPLEEDDPAGDPLDLGEEEDWRGVLKPAWGIDQTCGPTNEAEARRAWQLAQLEVFALQDGAAPAVRKIDRPSAAVIGARRMCLRRDGARLGAGSS
jgi:hypothetical protein